MNEKYKWKGVNISDITDTTSVDPISTNFGFNDYPATYIDETSTELSASPDGFVSNVNFSELSVPNNGYYCYTENEDNEAPPFKHNGQSIFTVKNNNNRIVVKNDSFTSGNGSVDIPEWCNAVKLYFVSIKGADGNAGTSLSETNTHKNVVENSAEENNQNENINIAPVYVYIVGVKVLWTSGENKNINHNNNKKQNINEHENIDWPATSGGAAGIGGVGKIGYFPRLIKFDSGTNNKLEYSINTGRGESSTVEIKENNSNSIASVTFVSGGDGGDGTNAVGVYNNYNFTLPYNYNLTAERNYNHNNKNYDYEGNTTDPGVDGDSGVDGSVTISSNNIEYLHYNSQMESNTIRLKVYYFKYE